MMVQTVKKDTTIQIMRGIAIIIVLARHAIAQVNAGTVLSALNEIIICFHMPVFFVIAGFLFQKGVNRYRRNGRVKFLMGKARHLLLPYIFWTVLLWAVVQAACMISPSVLEKMTEIGFAPMSVGNLIYGLLTYQVYYTEHLWFLYVLFALFAINIIAVHKGATISAVLIWGVIGSLTLFVSFPHIIERVMLWGIFFTFGRFVQLNKKPEKISGGYSTCISLIFIICAALRLIGLNSGIEGKTFAVLMLLDKYLIGFSGVGIVYILASVLKSKKAGTPIKCIGDYSFDIYLMHNPYCVALSAMVLNKILGVSAYMTVAVATVIGVVLPMAVSKFIIRKIKPLAVVMLGK